MKIYNNIKQIYKAYTEGIYADTPANRKLGRVGMSYNDYAKKLKEEKESKAEKKYYILQGEDGEEFMLEESKVSQDKIIELAEQYIKDQIEYNGRSIVKFNIQENTDDWSDEDFNTKQYDWFSFTGKKHGDKIEISIFDYNKGEFLRNDTLKREQKNIKQQHRRAQEKADKEFQEKFGWMEEYLKSKEKQLVNEDIKKKLQTELNRIGIGAFELGYGGYQFSGKNSDGNYDSLTISNISERELYEFEKELDELKVKYHIKYKVPSTTNKNIIKDLSIEFENENI